jgi:hypothetical protein
MGSPALRELERDEARLRLTNVVDAVQLQRRRRAFISPAVLLSPLMRETLAGFAAWLELTRFSRLLQTVEWAIPAVQTVHILAIAAAMGSMLLFNLRLLGVNGTDLPLVRASTRFIPVIWGSVLVLLASGAVMIAAEPGRSLLNPVFQLKMSLLLAALALTMATERPLRHNPSFWNNTVARGRVARVAAGLSIGLWIAILCAGRWIAYTRVH